MGKGKMNLKTLRQDLTGKYTNLLTFVALVLVLTVLTGGRCLQGDSIRNLLIAESVRAFAALGVGMIIISWGIDLSIGYVVCLTASVAASFAQTPGYSGALFPGVQFPFFMPIVAGIAVGGIFGLVNGILVAHAKLPPFIATLGTLSLARGLQLIYTKAAVIGSLKQEYKEISQGNLGPIPNLAIYVAIAAFIVWLILRQTKFGTNIYAVGGNSQAARVSGVNVEATLVKVYFFAGLLYGIAGVLQSSRLGLANALTANGMELDAIAAVTVGGVSQTGGVGSVSGMILGVLIMGIINYGMTYLNIDSYYQLLMKGAIIIGAVYFDMRKNARKA
jgi:methyl-galactoside transport system permease protein